MAWVAIRTRDVVASLIAGAAITVVVSWSLALHGASRTERVVERGRWPAAAGAGWPATARYATRYAATFARGRLEQWYAWGNHTGEYNGTFQMFVTRSGWPLLAMESVLRIHDASGFWDASSGPYDNDRTIGAGAILPLHWTRPQAAGGRGWCSRRLPLRPRPVGFAVNTIVSAVPVMMLIGLRRLTRERRSPDERRWLRLRWAHPVSIIAMGLLLNVTVSLGLWVRWQAREAEAALAGRFLRSVLVGEQQATRLPSMLASWPATVPEHWRAPKGIAWCGEAPGIRVYELMANGVPRAAGSAGWGSGTIEEHQRMLVTHAGWPLPCLQSAELFEIAGYDDPIAAAPGSAEERRERHRRLAGRVERRPAEWTILLPWAPQPADTSKPWPYVPLRPLAIGMVANTMLFAAAVGFMVLTLGAVRTLRREATGRCVECGYEVLELPRCPECGREREGLEKEMPGRREGIRCGQANNDATCGTP